MSPPFRHSGAKLLLALILSSSTRAFPVRGDEALEVKRAVFEQEYKALEAKQAELTARFTKAAPEQRRDATRNLLEANAQRSSALTAYGNELLPSQELQDDLIITIPAGTPAKVQHAVMAQAALDDELDEIASRYSDPAKRRNAIRDWLENN